MNRCLKIATLTLLTLISYPNLAQAFPGMTANGVVRWSRGHATLSPLRPTEKYEAGMSDFDTSIRVMDGTVSLSVFLDKRGLVESETIDYRPACYPNDNCSGTVLFEQNDRQAGSQLIQKIWGKAVLQDFQNSKLMETHKGTGIDGISRWYQGKLYNYETWHYPNNTIVHFTIVSKNSSQAERIRQFKYCETAPDGCGP